MTLDISVIIAAARVKELACAVETFAFNAAREASPSLVSESTCYYIWTSTLIAHTHHSNGWSATSHSCCYVCWSFAGVNKLWDWFQLRWDALLKSTKCVTQIDLIQYIKDEICTEWVLSLIASFGDSLVVAKQPIDETQSLPIREFQQKNQGHTVKQLRKIRS